MEKTGGKQSNLKFFLINLAFLFSSSPDAHALSCHAPSIPVVLSCSNGNCEVAFTVEKVVDGNSCAMTLTRIRQPNEIDIKPIVTELLRNGKIKEGVSLLELDLHPSCSYYLLGLNRESSVQSNESNRKTCITKSEVVVASSNTEASLRRKWSIKILISQIKVPAFLVFVFLGLELLIRKGQELNLEDIRYTKVSLVGAGTFCLFYYVGFWGQRAWLYLSLVLIFFGCRFWWLVRKIAKASMK